MYYVKKKLILDVINCDESFEGTNIYIYIYTYTTVLSGPPGPLSEVAIFLQIYCK